MSIPLPPLPEPVNKHGFNCIQTLDQLRARDQEIVRCVLEAAAKLFPQPHMEYFGQNIQDALRALEFHHE